MTRCLIVVSLSMLFACQSPGALSGTANRGSSMEPPANEQPLHTELHQLLLERMAALPERSEPLRVAVGDLGYGPDRIPTPFASALASELSLAMADYEPFVEYDRRDLNQVLDELSRTVSDLYAPQEEIAVGNLEAVHGIWTGGYDIKGDEIWVRLRLIDVTTARVMLRLSLERRLSAALRPLAMPPWLTSTEDTLQAIEPDGAPDFETSLWVDRGERAEYRFGERMRVHLRAEKDCYLKLYYVDASGVVQLIYPNRFSEQQRLRAGEVLTLPESDAYNFDLGAPAGIEVLFAETSTRPFASYEQDFEELGRREEVGSLRMRGIRVTANDGVAAERSWARCMISIRPD